MLSSVVDWAQSTNKLTIYLACEDSGRMLTHLFPACAFFFFFFEVEIISLTAIPLLTPGSIHIGSAS